MIENYITQIEVETDRSFGEISFLTLGEEKEGDKNNLPSISMKPEKMSFRLESWEASAKIESTKSNDSDEYGLDRTGLTKKALMDELVYQRQRSIVKEIWEISGEYMNDKDIRWWNQIFGKWNPPVGEENVITRIAHVAYLISKNSRRGPGNFLLISPMDIHIFESCVKFVYLNSGEILNPRGIYEIGSIMGITVLVDSYANRGELIIGRKATDCDGVVSIFSKPEFSELEVFEYDILEPSKILKLKNKTRVISIPGSESSYMNLKISYDRYPFLTHIKNRIKSLLK